MRAVKKLRPLAAPRALPWIQKPCTLMMRATARALPLLLRRPALASSTPRLTFNSPFARRERTASVGIRMGGFTRLGARSRMKFVGPRPRRGDEGQTARGSQWITQFAGPTKSAELSPSTRPVLAQSTGLAGPAGGRWACRPDSRLQSSPNARPVIRQHSMETQRIARRHHAGPPSHPAHQSLFFA